MIHQQSDCDAEGDDDNDNDSDDDNDDEADDKDYTDTVSENGNGYCVVGVGKGQERQQALAKIRQEKEKKAETKAKEISEKKKLANAQRKGRNVANCPRKENVSPRKRTATVPPIRLPNAKRARTTPKTPRRPLGRPTRRTRRMEEEKNEEDGEEKEQEDEAKQKAQIQIKPEQPKKSRNGNHHCDQPKPCGRYSGAAVLQTNLFPILPPSPGILSVLCLSLSWSLLFVSCVSDLWIQICKSYFFLIKN